jgi:hypothetical protein
VIDAPLPGLGHWDDQLKSPKVWHFNYADILGGDRRRERP